MPDAPLGTAFVDLRPSLDGFTAELEAELKAATAAVAGDVRFGLHVDPTAADAQVAATKAAASAPSTFHLFANTSAANTAVGATKARASSPATFDLFANAAPADATIDATRAKAEEPAVMPIIAAPAGGGAGGGGGGEGAGLAAAAGGAAGGRGGGGSSFGGALGGLLAGGGAGALGAIPGLGALGALPAFGSLGALAGVGPEAVLGAGVGVALSGIAAALGGITLAFTAASVAAVGFGTDLAGIGQAAGDIKNVTTAQEALTNAIQVYGPLSTQAATAQGQLNTALNGFSPIARGAVVSASNTIIQFKALFDQATGAAEATGAQIIQQVVQVGEKFLPELGAAAAKNMGIIQTGIQPFLEWLQGPGLSIFTDIENKFSSELPTAVHAGTQAFELLARTVDALLPEVGKFLPTIDNWVTRMNGVDFTKWIDGVGRLVEQFRTWEAFLKVVVQDVIAFGHDFAGTGQSIIQSLTGMLGSLHAYLTSAQGMAAVSAVFEAHKGVILELLQVLPGLVRVFGSIELALVPALAGAFATVLGVLLPFINAILEFKPAAFIAGLVLLAIWHNNLRNAIGLVTGTVNAFRTAMAWILEPAAATALAGWGAAAEGAATEIDIAGAQAEAGGRAFGFAGGTAAAGGAGFEEEGAAATAAAGEIDAAGARAAVGGGEFAAAGTEAGAAGAGIGAIGVAVTGIIAALAAGALAGFEFNKNLNETKNQSGITHDALIALEGAGLALVSPAAAAGIAIKFAADKLGIFSDNAKKAGPDLAGVNYSVSQMTPVATQVATNFDNLGKALGLTKQPFTDVMQFAVQTGLNLNDLSGNTAADTLQVVAHLKDVADGATGATPAIKTAAQQWIDAIHAVPINVQNDAQQTISSIDEIGSHFRLFSPVVQGVIRDVEMILGTLPPDLAAKGTLALQQLTDALKSGQPAAAASADAQTIRDQFNVMDQIPGMGARALSLLQDTIQSASKNVTQATKSQVNDLVNNYDKMAPDIQQQTVAAMAELDAGIATGNTNAINDATSKLATLDSRYQGLTPTIQTATAAAMTAMNTALASGNTIAEVAVDNATRAMQRSYQDMPPPIQAAMQSAMTDLNLALQQGNSTAANAVEQAAALMEQHYKDMPAPVQTAIQQAMQDLNMALASGNQTAIDDTTQKLKFLVGVYQGTAKPAGQAGTDTGNAFADSARQALVDKFGGFSQTVQEYDTALLGGLTPIQASIEAVSGVNINQIPLIGQITGHGTPLGGAAQGGLVTSPGLFMAGEEAPGHAETIISHNPAYHAANVGYWAQAGKALGIPGFQTGGFTDPSMVPKPPALTPTFGIVDSSFGVKGQGLLNAEYSKTVEVATKVAAAAAAQAAAAAFAGAGGGGSGPAHDLGQQMAAARGWVGSEWAVLDSLINRESGWNPNAANPTSDARGIGQDIRGWEGSNQPGDAAGQIQWAYDYIVGRYGDPQAAWNHEMAFNWYDSGGLLPPGLSLAYNGTGVHEPVLSPNVPLGGGGAFGGSIDMRTTIIVQGSLDHATLPQVRAEIRQNTERINRGLSLRGINAAPGGVLR